MRPVAAAIEKADEGETRPVGVAALVMTYWWRLSLRECRV